MKIVLTKNITCTDSDECSKNIISKIKLLTGANIEKINRDDTMDSHISIHHVQGAHKIWVFFYDNDGKHESEKKGKTIIKNSQSIKKFKGTKPTTKQLEDTLD